MGYTIGIQFILRGYPSHAGRNSERSLTTTKNIVGFTTTNIESNISKEIALLTTCIDVSVFCIITWYLHSLMSNLYSTSISSN